MQKNNPLQILVVDDKINKADVNTNQIAQELSANTVDRDFTTFLKSLFKSMDKHDASVGLPSRSLLAKKLKDSIARSEENNCMFGVLFFDLDRSKLIDNSLTQQARNEVLRVIEDRLHAIMRSDDTFVRLGGDEFVIIANEVHRDQDLIAISKKLIKCLKESVTHFGHKLMLTINIDISVYPRDLVKINLLLQNADTD